MSLEEITNTADTSKYESYFLRQPTVFPDYSERIITIFTTDKSSQRYTDITAYRWQGFSNDLKN